MIGKLRRSASAALMLVSLVSLATAAQDTDRGAVACADLNWSAEVLAANPDIARACQGVYEKDGVLYAKATIEVVGVQGSTLRFRALFSDGTKGKRRSVTLGSQWRASIAGKQYHLGDLTAGQRLDVFLPEDRFALKVVGSNKSQATAIEEAP